MQTKTEIIIAKITNHINEMLMSKTPQYAKINDIPGAYVPVVFLQQEIEAILKVQFDGHDFEYLKTYLDEIGVTKEISMVILEQLPDLVTDFMDYKK
jgi:hypothetical protein